MKIVIIMLFFLYGCVDMLRKKVPYWMLMAGMVLCLILRLSENRGIEIEDFYALLPGAFFIVVATCSRQSVGYGDGICLLILGLVVKAETAVFSTLIGIMLAFFYAIYLFAVKRKRKETIPFLPFLFVGIIGGMLVG